MRSCTPPGIRCIRKYSGSAGIPRQVDDMRRRGHSGAGERCRCGRGLSVTGNRQRSAGRAWRLGTESNVEWNVLASCNGYWK